MSHRILISVLLLALAGCAAIHSRLATDLEGRLDPPRRILVLPPDIEVRVKNISTDEFFVVKGECNRFAMRLEDSLRKTLAKRGHRLFARVEPGRVAGHYDRFIELRDRLVELADSIVKSDLDYSRRVIPESFAVPDAVPRSFRDRVDLVLAIKATCRKETWREFWWRWFGNVGWNLATFPISVASAFIPITMPVSINLSTSVFEHSPDRVFVSVVVIDARDGRALYQCDYFNRSAPEQEEEFDVISREILDAFGP